MEKPIDSAALKKAKDDAVAANIKILENLYSFLISLALTQATIKLVDTTISKGISLHFLDNFALYASLLATIVPFYQGMNRFLYETHVVRPLEKPDFKSSPMLLDIYSFLLMGSAIFAMGRFVDNPPNFFYLWSILLIVDVAWSLIVWKIQKSRAPIWALNNFFWLALSWALWGINHNFPELLAGSAKDRIATYGLAILQIFRSILDYKINWKFYFPPEYKGF